jgi:hypothetical protein
VTTVRAAMTASTSDGRFSCGVRLVDLLREVPACRGAPFGVEAHGEDHRVDRAIDAAPTGAGAVERARQEVPEVSDSARHVRAGEIERGGDVTDGQVALGGRGHRRRSTVGGIGGIKCPARRRARALRSWARWNRMLSTTMTSTHAARRTKASFCVLLTRPPLA